MPALDPRDHTRRRCHAAGVQASLLRWDPGSRHARERVLPPPRVARWTRDRGRVNSQGTIASARSIVSTSDDARSSPDVQVLFRENASCDGPRQTPARQILSPPRHRRAPPRSKRQRTTSAARGNKRTRIGGRKKSGNPTVGQWVPHQSRLVSLPARRLRVRRAAVATFVPTTTHAPRGTQLLPSAAPPAAQHRPRTYPRTLSGPSGKSRPLREGGRCRSDGRGGGVCGDPRGTDGGGRSNTASRRRPPRRGRPRSRSGAP